LSSVIYPAQLSIALAVSRIVTGEDSWICKDGKWVEHGHPSSEKPNEPCEESFMQKLFS
jgi:hypothetical protein